ncbi:hypothetical protein Tco_0767042 [Tanacetum coccineum]
MTLEIGKKGPCGFTKGKMGQKKQKPRKPKRKDTEAPQPSGPTTNVADEVFTKENVIKHSNDLLLSGEDSMKLEELMELSSLGDQKDASKQERKIDDIDADAGITLVDETQGRHDDDLMFDTDVLNDEEVFARQDMAEKEVSTVDPVTTIGEVVTTANVEVSTASPTAATITNVELTLALTLA